jgi:RNA polymerase sigma-70 factor, ECF subfamily
MEAFAPPGVKKDVSCGTMVVEEGMGTPRQLDPQALGDHIDRLYRAARSLTGSREEAEDLVQETFARVLQKPRLLRSDDDIGYLLRVLRNTFISMRRSAARRPQATAPPEALDYIEDEAAVRPQARMEMAEVYAAISELPPDFRDAVIAIDVVGLSYRQAANALRVREATITTRLHRGRQRIARSLAADQEALSASRSPGRPAQLSRPGTSQPASFASCATLTAEPDRMHVWPSRCQVTTSRPSFTKLCSAIPSRCVISKWGRPKGGEARIVYAI